MIVPTHPAIWSKRFGDYALQQGVGLAVDDAGDIIATGSFVSSIDFGLGDLYASGIDDIYLAKLGGDGAPIWSKRFGGPPGNFSGHRVRIDSMGGIVLTGHYLNWLDFGDGALPTASCYTSYVARFDDQGETIWSQALGPPTGLAFIHGLAIDADDGVVGGGNFGGAVDFGGEVLDSVGDGAAFVFKKAFDGSLVWARMFGGEGACTIDDIALDGSGNIIGVGTFTDTVDFGGGPLNSTSSYATFAVALDASGNHLWSEVLANGISVEADAAVAVHPSSDIFIGAGGRFDGSPPRYGDFFVARLAPDGSVKWVTSFDTDFVDVHLESLAVDASGSPVIAGRMGDPIDFGGGPIGGAGYFDAFLARFDSNGQHLWSTAFGDDDYQEAADVQIAADGSIFVTGSFDGTVDFGSGPLVADGYWDVFIAKFAP